MVSQETELKLAVTPRTLAKLAQDPQFGTPRDIAQRLLAVYYDSARHALRRRGMALRLRREHGHWVQTLKGGGALEAGLQRRAELAHQLASATPDLSRLEEHELGKRAVRALRGAPLAPVFRVEVERDTRRLTPDPGTTIALSLDRGMIGNGTLRAPICEIELELESGPPWRLFELALAIAARYPVRIEQRSKAERGYALAGASRPAPIRGRLGVIRRDMSTSEAFSAVCIACLNHLQANQSGVLRGEDPEYLHQARVALRRLRSALDAFAPLAPREMFAPRAKAVRRLTRALGPARDWDVFLAQTLAPVTQQFPGHRGLLALERASQRLRAAANRGARRALGSRREQALLLEMGGWLAAQPWRTAGAERAQAAWQAPIREHAVQVLERCHRRALKRGRAIGGAGLARLHRLRIAVKKLRYAASYFRPLFVRTRADAMLEALNELQDLLGAINDGACAPELIAAASAAARGPLRPQARAIIGHWSAAMLADRRRALKRAWKAFRKCERFWH